ncbi:hypothetical protein NQ315_002037 [Exocentrus adspersus]|uniref:Endonuclease/exonuclease/phosphatase domain-containing protein n=1 Tax=Exocentrus adspersus TaxID=1586481 RepID=A0AAV8VFH6_9CUCU|nr:hypothetical protein NQ315_002037 [Exocentrus adspersus]
MEQTSKKSSRRTTGNEHAKKRTEEKYGKTEIVKKTGEVNNEGNKELKIGTWNVRGTFEERKLKHLLSEVQRCNFDIVALQETKQAGELVMEVAEYIFINSGGTDRMLGKYQKITLMHIHAPHEKNELQVKEEFYRELDRIYEEIPRYDIKIVLGDISTKTGSRDYATADYGKLYEVWEKPSNQQLSRVCRGTRILLEAFAQVCQLKSWAISTVFDLLIILRFRRHLPAVFREALKGEDCWLPISFQLWTL